MSNLPTKGIVFGSDTSERKKWFTGLHFSHPAKMHLSLQIYLIEHYTKPGDTILDPMFGSGTLLVACALGRHVIGVELEQKFVDMAKANWEKIKSLGAILGYTMGTATIIQGDARDLPKVLADVICTSPPYEGSLTGEVDPKQIERIRKGVAEGKITGRESVRVAQKGFNPHTCLAIDKGYAPKADVCCFSPPYEASVTGKDGIDWSKGTRGKAEGNKPRDKSKEPAFEHSAVGGAGFRYSEANNNIGNLKSQNYLEAMALVYRSCFRVLRDGGLMILVVKSFIRNKKVIDLAADTIKLCECCGFVLKERLARKLTQQSFWRTIYYKKHPDAPKIEFEDILVFQKIKQ